MPLFSVIIPTYNRATMLPKAIESVLNQTVEDWELIVVDDGSTDTTKEVVLAYDDPRIRYIYQENAERSAARNNGIRNSHGTWICFLDSDDWYTSNRLHCLLDGIQKNGLEKALYFTEISFIEGELLSTPKVENPTGQNVADYLLRNRIGNPQVSVHRSLLETHQFNERIHIGEDTELWMRICVQSPLIFIPACASIVALQHEDRSVNLRHKNSAQEELTSLNLIFAGPMAKNISKNVRKQILSGCYFNMAKHHMYNNGKGKAIAAVLKSIITDLKSPQLKHRIYCLLSLFRFKIPAEYR